ncbi:unnamed protein product, partial [Adineta steineri]
CPISCRIFRDPIVTQCSHTFCRRCISTTIQCPYDQQILQTFVSNHSIAEQIDSLLVWCKYSFKRFQVNSGDIKNERDEYGCPVKIPFNKKKEHEDECTYRFVPCPNGCLLNNLRQKVSNHIYSMLKNLDTLKSNQEALCSRNDLLLSELMKTKQTSPIPTTIDEQESVRNHDSDDDNDLPSVILRCNGTFTGHNDAIWCLYALDDVLLSGSSDKTVK